MGPVVGPAPPRCTRSEALSWQGNEQKTRTGDLKSGRPKRLPAEHQLDTLEALDDARGTLVPGMVALRARVFAEHRRAIGVGVAHQRIRLLGICPATDVHVRRMTAAQVTACS